MNLGVRLCSGNNSPGPAYFKTRSIALSGV